MPNVENQGKSFLNKILDKNKKGEVSWQSQANKP